MNGPLAGLTDYQSFHQTRTTSTNFAPLTSRDLAFGRPYSFVQTTPLQDSALNVFAGNTTAIQNKGLEIGAPFQHSDFESVFFFYLMTLICPSYFIQAYLRKSTGYIRFRLHPIHGTAQQFRNVPRSPASYPLVHSTKSWTTFLLRLPGMHFNQDFLRQDRSVRARICYPCSRCSPEHLGILPMARLHQIQT